MLMAAVSPANVQSRAQVALQCSPISELRNLLVDQREHALWISGTVSSFYHKQLAQEVVWALCRDIDVELVNQVRVA